MTEKPLRMRDGLFLCWLLPLASPFGSFQILGGRSPPRTAERSKLLRLISAAASTSRLMLLVLIDLFQHGGKQFIQIFEFHFGLGRAVDHFSRFGFAITQSN